jgi:acylphosphatase
MFCSMFAYAGTRFMPRVRRRARFSGRVQGVGFRFTCQSIARGYEVEGYVRNLPDGDVELVAEGEPLELEKFQQAIAFEMSAYIRGVDICTEPADTDPLIGFSIRH